MSDHEPQVPYLLAGGGPRRELPPLPERHNIFKRQRSATPHVPFLGRKRGDYTVISSAGNCYWILGCRCGHTRKVNASSITANRVYRCPNRPVCQGDGTK